MCRLQGILFRTSGLAKGMLAFLVILVDFSDSFETH